MILRIARKELVEIVRDGRFLACAAILLVLLVAALAMGAQRHAEDERSRAEASAETRTQWLSQGEKGPHAAAHYGVHAFKPASPLALFDPGYNDYTGTIQYLEAHKENLATFRPAADATALQRFGDLSGAMLLQLLVPLLVILMGFAMFTGEREDGTLRQLLAMGVPGRTLMLGKALGVALALAAVLVPAFAIGIGLAFFIGSTGDPHDAVGIPAVLLLVAGYVAFLAIFLCLSLAASLLARSSASALTLLVGFWIVASLLVPHLAVDVSRRIAPVPSSFAVTARIEEGRARGPRAHEPNHPNHIAFRDEMLKTYGVSRIEDLPFSFAGLALQRDEENGFRVFDAAYGEVRAAYARQDAVQQTFAWLSPVMAIRTLSAALSGTDVPFATDFSRAAEAYRREMVRVMNDDLMRNAAGMSTYQAEWGYRADEKLWNRLQPFDFEPPAFATVVARNLSSIATLVVWLIASVALLVVAARRIRVDG